MDNVSKIGRDIPEQLKRDVLVESGHRCAIPTCKQTPVEIAHIVPWETVKEHTFDNLIALCPNCHDRYDKKHEIDRKAMLQYKANLSIINYRYGDMERRILELFAEDPNARYVWIPGGLDILILYLIKDAMLIESGKDSGVYMSGIPSSKEYFLTDKGKEFIEKWVQAKVIQ